MNRNDLPPVTKTLRRTRWILFALLVLAPLALLAQSQYAQKNGLRGEEKRAAAAGRKSKGAEEEAAEAAVRGRFFSRAKPSRRSELSPTPISMPAAGFAVSRPLSEVAKRAPKATRRAERLGEEEDDETSENEVTRVVSAKAKAEADEAVAKGLKRDTALQ